MMILQDAGRIALAQAFAARTLHIAIGAGLPAWDAAPEPPGSDQTTLVAEVGRRLVTDIRFVVPDPDGSISMPSGNRYNFSDTPTAWLLLQATFDYAEAQGEQVREMGLFLDGATDPALPPGQYFFTPSQVTQPGGLYALERRAVETRSGERQSVERLVIPF